MIRKEKPRNDEGNIQGEAKLHAMAASKRLGWTLDVTSAGN